MKKSLLTFIAVLATLLPITASAAVSTWSFEWNMSKKEGGQGFYNFGSTKVEKEFYTAELNGLQWKATAEGTYIYAYTSTMGQYIGSASAPCKGCLVHEWSRRRNQGRTSVSPCV